MAALTEILSSGSIFNFLSRKCRCIFPSTSAFARKNHSDTTQGNENYDIIISGGGMVGTTLACAIANNQRLRDTKVLLLEGGSEQQFVLKPDYSNRVVSLNQLSRTLLSNIGVWKHIEAIRYAKINMMQVWDAYSNAIITFNEDNLEEDLAYVVETDVLLHAVNQELSKTCSTKVEYNAKVHHIRLPKKDNENATVQLENGKQFAAKLVIGADGMFSKVREAMDVQYIRWQYEQNAIVATLKLSEPTENRIAWQRFLPTGPIALLPLSDEYSSLVWSTTKSDTKALMKMEEETFVDRINEALWKEFPKDTVVEHTFSYLQNILRTFSLNDGVSRQLQPSVSGIVKGSRGKFPLGFGHSVHYVKPGVVLVGDAAHRVHPLAGQGVNLGFGDIVTLVELLSETVWCGSAINDMIYLREYQSRRQAYIVPMMMAIDAFDTIYRRTATPLVVARSLGMQVINALPTLKNILKTYANDERKAFYHRP